MKVAFLVVAAIIALVLLSGVLLQGQDLCLGGKSLVPCDWMPDAMEIKIHDDPEDR
jgi:hypothetical protein